MRKVAYLGVLILIAVVGVSIALSQKASRPPVTAADGAPKITATSSPPYVPADQGEANGGVPNFQPGGDDLRASVLAQPLPQVWLVSPAQGGSGAPGAGKAETVRVDLPDEANTALTPVWQAYLAYHLKINFEDDKEVQKKRVDQDMAMVATAPAGAFAAACDVAGLPSLR